MSAMSISKIVLPPVALLAACGAALVFAITHVPRARPVETSAATAAPTLLPPGSSDRDERTGALAAVQAEANSLAKELAISPTPPVTDDSVPVFDIARIEPTGEAVIAGRAAPGAIVELLRNGERLDETAAGRSGQFVMVPARLPPGNYELTLRSRLPDGTLATSRQGVAVALAEAETSPGVNRSRAEVPSDIPASAAAGPSDKASSGPVAESKIEQKIDAEVGPKVEPKTTTVVSRGDSLWRISRATYGVGTRYAIVYQANRERIRDPNRIYPGQIFVLPLKAR
jgi:nucleoid-associated protein YgaU